jgi:hypothetical protein
MVPIAEEARFGCGILMGQSRRVQGTCRCSRVRNGVVERPRSVPQIRHCLEACADVMFLPFDELIQRPSCLM